MEENKKEKKSFNIFKLGYKFIVSLSVVLVVLVVTIVLLCGKIDENKKTYDNVICFDEKMDEDVVIFNITGDYEEVTFSGDCGSIGAVKGGSNIYKVTVKNTSKKAIDYTVTPKVVYDKEYGIPLYFSVSAPKEEYIVGSPKEFVKYNEVEGLSFSETLKSEKEDVFYVTVKLLHSDTSIFNEEVDIDFVFDVETKVNEEVKPGFTGRFVFIILLFVIWISIVLAVLVFVLLHAFVELNKGLIEKNKELKKEKKLEKQKEKERKKEEAKNKKENEESDDVPSEEELDEEVEEDNNLENTDNNNNEE